MEENSSSTPPLVQQPPNYGNLITVLSIDGGGIRGIIPATILAFLESQLQVKSSPDLDVKLSDICISTSAAPTFLPAHYFTNQDINGNVRELNLIDGGVAANNPALVGITQVTKQIYNKNPDFFPIKPMHYERFLVISIGTGTAKLAKKYTAKMAAKWGIVQWLIDDGAVPLVDVFSQASTDMVDFHISVVFQALHSEDRYLRIQDGGLVGTESSVDIATKENLEKLVQIGERLLKKPVSRVNLETGLYESVQDGAANEDALIKFAKLLSAEKKLRHTKLSTKNI